MRFFDRLKAESSAEWAAYVDHPFVRKMGDASLPQAAFRHYLVQDYLFLIQFARAYALAVYKSPTLGDMRQALAGVKAILDMEMDLHVELCAGWGLSRDALERAREERQTMAYTRFVLDAGGQGDLLDLMVALAPCVFGYAEIGKALAATGRGQDPANPYSRWIGEYASDAYQDVAAGFEDWLDRIAADYETPARWPRLSHLFAQASILEADFWQMGLDAA